MFEDISIKREYTAFHGYAWKHYNTQEPRVHLAVADGAGGQGSQDLSIAEAQELIQMLNDLIVKAQSIPDHEPWDEGDSPF
jgi:hypothetical protein